MKAPLGLTLCLLAHLLIEVACNDGGFNIHGGYYDVYTADSSRKLETRNRWGASNSGSQSNRKVIDGCDGLCWKDGGAFCFLKFVVSSTNQPNEEHYQLMGSKMIIKNIRSTSTLQNFGWGVQEALNGVEDHVVADGYLWSSELSDWGYGYLHLFVKKTTRPSLTDAFLYERRNKGSERIANSTWTGQKTPTSVPNMISNFRSWTTEWHFDSIGRWNVYRSLTKLVDYTPIYEEKTVKPVVSNIYKSLTLENRGSGVTSNGSAKIGSTETVSLSTTTTIESTFDFSVDNGASVSMDIDFVSASLDINLHSGYSTTSSTENSKTTSASTIEWPSTCPPGTRIEVVIFKITEEQSVPIEFTFERNGERFSERRTLEAKVNKILQQLTSCCLDESASPECGSPDLKMC